MFSVVQTRKGRKFKPQLTVVPTTWVGNNCVFWPPNSLVSLSRDASSRPGQTWNAGKAKILASEETYEAAESMMTELEKLTDSEEAEVMETRYALPKKKDKFSTKCYQLIDEISECDIKNCTVSSEIPKLDPTYTLVANTLDSMQSISSAPMVTSSSTVVANLTGTIPVTEANIEGGVLSNGHQMPCKTDDEMCTYIQLDDGRSHERIGKNSYPA
ncbi:uncharacterized protein LOC131436134 [Malaya genurostris]|uniref:uncharacterized protein LOC131425456 n=1 Tax=Malaya genurostris TaxID=325434 RepID=UPI0026F3B313|nr:uncharacterized protein LOC131425456 [Malaya genurostris]XP_058460633.1 uncharacterized protein LOC131436134 [Malaya genurostris]